MKRQRIKTGAIVKIPIEKEYHTYGRLLLRPYVEIYDGKTKENISRLEEIVSKPILFTLCVFDYAVTKGRWEIIGRTDFSENEVNIPLQFIQDPINPKSCQTIDALGNMEPASVEQCRKLERSAVWDPEHIEERIKDYYAGKPNKWAESLRFKE
jgi:hypothetical protein